MGHGEIDAQHRRFIGQVNGIVCAVKNGAPQELLRSLAEEMIADTFAHFATEEAVLATIGGLETAAHEQEHRRLEKRLTELREGLLDSGSALGSVYEIRAALLDHLVRFDLAYKSRLMMSLGR